MSSGNSASSSGGTSIPSSTVVAIGGGFVCFALVTLVCLTLFRVVRIWLAAKRRRERGEDITFRQLWREGGGAWGFLSGIGTDPSLSSRDRHEIFIARMRQEVRLWELARQRELNARPLPQLYEIEVQEKGVRGVDHLDIGDCYPLAVNASDPPDRVEYGDTDDHLLEPELALSVLVLYPSLPSSSKRKLLVPTTNEDEWEEIPEMVVGSTNILPYINRSRTDPNSQSTDTENQSGDGNEKQWETFHDENSLGKQSEHREEDNSNRRRAGWTREDKVWKIEGL